MSQFFTLFGALQAYLAIRSLDFVSVFAALKSLGSNAVLINATPAAIRHDQGHSVVL